MHSAGFDPLACSVIVQVLQDPQPAMTATPALLRVGADLEAICCHLRSIYADGKIHMCSVLNLKVYAI